MADEAQHKESENHARIRMERLLMQTFGATRSDARKALRQDAAERRAQSLSATSPAAAALGGQQLVKISETVHEAKKIGGVGDTADNGGTPPSSTPSSIGTIRTILLVSGVFQFWDLQGTYFADV